MTLELPKVKEGDKLKLRCGGIVDAENPSCNSRFFYCDIGDVSFVWDKSTGFILDNLIEHPFDIIEVIPKPEPRTGEFWANVNDDGVIVAWDNKKEADRYASPNRIACVKVNWTEGEGL